MADFYLLIARAVERLPEQSPERRRAVYERARSALMGQLHALDPPYSEAELARLVQLLDDAISRVEALYGASRSAPQPPPIVIPDRTKPLGLEPRPAEETGEALTLLPPERRVETLPERGTIAKSRSAGRGAYVPEDERSPSKIRTRDTSTPANRLAIGLVVLVVVGASTAAWVLRDTFMDRPTLSHTERQRAPETDPATLSSERIETAEPRATSPSAVEQTPTATPSVSAQTPAGLSSPEPQPLQGSIPPPRTTLAEQAPDTPTGSLGEQAPDPPTGSLGEQAPDPPTGSVGEQPEAKAEPSAHTVNIPETPSPLLMTEPAPVADALSKTGSEPASHGPSPGAVVAAQRAALFEENKADPQSPRVIPGSAVWGLEALPSGQDQSLETVVRSVVDVPEVGLQLDLVIRRNVDQVLSASHLIELTFTTPNDPARTVREVGILQLKTDEADRGTPLAGLPVPVKENVFLIGLSGVPQDVESNTDLLVERNWIDLPIHFSSGLRAILQVEKGTSGEEALQHLFREGSPQSALSTRQSPGSE
jgi:hypothetical protein